MGAPVLVGRGPVLAGRTELRTAVYSSNFAPIGFKLRQNAFRTIPGVSFFDGDFVFSATNLDRNFSFSLFWPGFGGATATSKSDSASNVALDTSILRSVRPKIMKIR